MDKFPFWLVCIQNKTIGATVKPLITNTLTELMMTFDDIFQDDI